MIGADAETGHMPANDEALARHAREIRAQVAAATERSGRPADAVLIVAVSKTMPAERLRAAYNLGFTTFGENRVQEARDKIAALSLPGLRWELIGHLQTNKAALAVELFDRVQSVDSVKLAETLERHAEAKQKVLP
ncbi:MAG TPA: YggS family pyridoxal phosphate-dependent enzyme, partial [Ktedonobacterales bacterium]|nr:YggS family pyridoxal phosphate-dependent enzyme [Ktedonobacterales bacterium]